MTFGGIRGDGSFARPGRLVGWTSSSPRTRTTGSWAGTRCRSPRSSPLSRVSRAGQRVLDVGCGPGALTTELVRRLGADAVAAVDPSEPFVRRGPRAAPRASRVELASAEHLPFPDHAFDAALAQLVVHFMTDPVAGLTEMARVTRPGGVVAACVWDHGGGQGPLGRYWRSRAAPRSGRRRRVRPARRPSGAARRAVRERRPARDRGDEPRRQRGASDASTTGGSRSRSAWDRPAPMLRASIPFARRSFESAVGIDIRTAPFVVTARAWAARGRV